MICLKILLKNITDRYSLQKRSPFRFYPIKYTIKFNLLLFSFCEVPNYTFELNVCQSVCPSRKKHLKKIDRGVLLGNKYRIQKTAAEVTLEILFEFKKKILEPHINY